MSSRRRGRFLLGRKLGALSWAGESLVSLSYHSSYLTVVDNGVDSLAITHPSFFECETRLSPELILFYASQVAGSCYRDGDERRADVQSRRSTLTRLEPFVDSLNIGISTRSDSLEGVRRCMDQSMDRGAVLRKWCRFHRDGARRKGRGCAFLDRILVVVHVLSTSCRSY